VSRADVTPEDLRRFAASLQNYITEVSERSFQLQAQFRELGDTWRDQKYRGFAQEFEQTMRVLNHFLNTAQQQSPTCCANAQAAEQYLQQH